MLYGMTRDVLEPHEVTLHGHRVSYRTAGRGPVLLLLHGIANSSQTWEPVASRLQRHFTLVAPDLLGHGASATPRGDYSLGAHATGVRDILTALGYDHVTVVGHSLGGGIAMQFAYQFPERCERLVLVSSGGLGREVHLLLRAAALPGADWVLPLLSSSRLHGIGRTVGALLRHSRLSSPGDDREVLARGFASLDNAGSRRAFLHTLRAVVEPGGQRVSAANRLRLAVMPTLIVWGERDSIIPVSHGTAAHEAIPGSRLVVLPDAGHMPHHDDPTGFADALTSFCQSTAPARLTADHWQPALDDDTGDGTGR
jgi:pimeloyl-ACP methyl ester carboxylesterase